MVELLIFPNHFREEKWTIIKEFSYLLLIIFCIGLANLVYSTWFINIRLTLPTLGVGLRAWNLEMRQFGNDYK